MNRPWTIYRHALIALVAIVIALAAAPRKLYALAAAGPLPAVALQELLDGNARFVGNRPIHPNARPSRATQHPIAAILSCADSRVPPEMIFDQGVGNIFIVRVAGNTYDRLAFESLHFAVANLGARLIVVMGHDQCGAVSAAVKAYPDPKAGPMLANIYPAVTATRGRPGNPVGNAIAENARLVAQRLAAEPELAPLVARGELRIVPARYNLKTGAVTVLPAK
ncbi:MAG TPA: carbonic anhydrase [Candidatus Binataceae bacterium]|nr:carbonic anhydrase [Candidatus Binataceae bacterium]